MVRKLSNVLVFGVVAVLAVSTVSEARVVRFTVDRIRPFAGGVSFGDAGPYERLDGTAELEVVPAIRSTR